MARARGGGRRRRAAHVEENEDRWLLTDADMITLLMALFMVLFSISSVNTSKYESLQRALQDAFSGRILPGGKSVQQNGASTEPNKPSPEPPIPALQPLSDTQGDDASRGSQSEDESFKELKKRLDAYAKRHGLAEQVEVTIARRGLVIKLLTDNVLFDSGEAVLKPGAKPLLAQVSGLVRVDDVHPVMVEGHTDNVPIRGSRFPSNWELSTARASAVVRYLLSKDVVPDRLGASGFAALHPAGSNSTDEGRSRNRRVEIVLLRTGQAGNDPPVGPAARTEGGAAPADDPFEGLDKAKWLRVPGDSVENTP